MWAGLKFFGLSEESVTAMSFFRRAAGVFLFMFLVSNGVATGAQGSSAQYPCADTTASAAQVQLNIGRPGGYVQLLVPVSVMQPGNLAQIRDCLLRHNLFTDRQAAAYTRAVAQCRERQQRNKVVLKKGPINRISTKTTQGADQCLQQAFGQVLDDSRGSSR